MTNAALQGNRRQPTLDEMESLFVNVESLDRIKAYLNRFNPIRVMKMERMEIRHSSILAWLLDPRETHGFGDKFLKAFLGEALRGHSDLGTPTALDISQSDLRDADVRCEWQSIDILIFCPANCWAFVIENKFDSMQGEGQLAGYIARIQSLSKDWGSQLQARGIFLTLHDEAPADPRYVPIRYGTICKLLSRLIKQHADQLSGEVTTFLNHYLEILEDAAGMSKERNEMELLARQLYRRHKKVLDFVIEHGAASEFAMAARSLFGEDPDRFARIKIDSTEVVFTGLANSLVSFLPLSWYEGLGKDAYAWPGCENWWAGFPVISWLQLWASNDGVKGTLWLYAEVGPLSDYEFRKALIERIQSVVETDALKIAFQKGAANEGKQFSKFLKKNVVQIVDIHNSDELESGIKKLLANFRNEFDAIGAILPQFLERGVSIRR